MSKTKIFIAIIAIAVIGIVALIVISLKSPVSPGVSEETGGETADVQENAPVAETEAPNSTPVAETETVNTPVDEKTPSEKVEDYEIVSNGVSTNNGIKGGIYDIITGKLAEAQAKTLAEKIVKDITAKDSSLKEITLLFYSNKDSAIAGKYDVAYVVWSQGKVSVRMITE